MSIPIPINYPVKGDIFGGTQAQLTAKTVYPNKTTASIEQNIDELTKAIHKQTLSGNDIAVGTTQIDWVPFNNDHDNIDVFFNGVLAEEGRDYTITSGWNINWIDETTLEPDDRIQIKVFGYEPT